MCFVAGACLLAKEQACLHLVHIGVLLKVTNDAFKYPDPYVNQDFPP